MLTLFGFEISSPSNKVRFAANAMGLQYEYKRVNLFEGEQKNPEFLKLNPIGRVPAINDDGFFAFESTAIIRYLAEKNNSPLYPNDLKKRTIINEWMDFTNMHVTTAMQKVTYNRIFYKFRNDQLDERSLSDGIKFLAQHLPLLEKQLKENKFLAGNEMSLADINLLAALDPAEASGVDLSAYPALKAWRTNLKTQSFYTKCHKSWEDVLNAMMAAAAK